MISTMRGLGVGDTEASEKNVPSKNGFDNNQTPSTSQLIPDARRVPIIPYDIQREGAMALIASDGNPLAVYATGCGKSVVVGEVCRRLDVGTLVLVPTRELCEQNETAICAVWPEANVGVLCAGLERREHDARILIATVQSIYSLDRQGKLDAIGRRELMIVDEAHLVPAGDVGMYRTIIQALKPVKVMGLTATPWRLESGRLDEGDDRLFDRVVYEFGLQEGIAWCGPDGERLLLPLVAKKTVAAIDTNGVTVRGGDYVESELSDRANTNDLVEAAVDEILRYAAGRRHWLAFCCGADHSEHVAETLSARGVTARAITYHTSSEARRDSIAAYRRGEITCLTGCGIFTTGFNVPEVDLIAFLRPTKSPVLYVQMGGRGTRYARGKTDCLILDFARNVERLGPIDDPRIPGPRAKDENRAERSPADMKACPECHTYLMAAASYCSECGHIFEAEPAGLRHGAVASELPIMSPGLIWLDVVGASARPHCKDGSPPSLRILYRTASGERVAQWLALQHPRARRFAERGWRDLGGELPAPATVSEALQRVSELRRPAQIGVKRAGQWWKIGRVRHANAR